MINYRATDFPALVRFPIRLALAAALAVAGCAPITTNDGSVTKVRDGETSPGGMIRSKLIERSKGKGNHVTLSLSLSNPYDHPTWFLISSGRFSSSRITNDWDFSEVPFQASKYDEGDGAAIIVTYFSRCGFKAFHLPSGGNTTFSGFSITSSNRLTHVSIWTADKVLVNGTTRLERWIPFPITSSKEVKIKGQMYSGKQTVLDIENARLPDEKLHPNEKVDFVAIESIGRYEIELLE